jgi:SAM-dependent methyltransferase
MGDSPEEEAARAERLQAWASQQARLQQRRNQKVPKPNVLMRLGNRLLDRGLETGERIVTEEHDHGERTIYMPSAWHTLPRALRHTGVSKDDVFVDLGCGKGRVVHQAARRPFKKVIGVEISEPLAEAARAALAARSRQHKCRDVEIVVADARDYQVPDDLTIAYLFHPFHGETLDTVLGNLVASLDRNPRRLHLIYGYPLFAKQIEATGRFERVNELRGGVKADSLYRTLIYESR